MTNLFYDEIHWTQYSGIHMSSIMAWSGYGVVLIVLFGYGIFTQKSIKIITFSCQILYLEEV